VVDETHSLLSIGWGIAGPPLDAAPYTGLLVPVDWLPGEYCVDGGAEIEACHRLVITGTTVVELASIDQLWLGIKEVEVRGTGGLIGLRHFLGVVEAEGKLKVEKQGHLLEPFGSIFRIVHGIVAADTDDAEAGTRIILPDPGNFVLDMYHVRTMPTKKHYQ